MAQAGHTVGDPVATIGSTAIASTSSAQAYSHRVIEAAGAAVAGRPERHLDVAGQRVRMTYSNPALEQALFPALEHLEGAPGEGPGDFTLWAWADQGAMPLVLDAAPWRLREAWAGDQIVSIRTDRGYVLCDPQARTVSVYDRDAAVAVVWTPDASALSFWVPGAPFLAALNWWLADRGVALCHAAAIGTPDGAVLIVGPSGSGKSTLALSSLQTSLRYLGDDYVAVDQASTPPVVYSLFNTAKMFQVDMERLLPGLAPDAGIVQDAARPKALFHLHRSHPDKILLESPLRAVLVPHREEPEDRAPAVARTTASAAFRALAPSTVLQLPGNARTKYEMLSNLVRRVPAWEVWLSSDLERNVALIADLIASGDG